MKKTLLIAIVLTAAFSVGGCMVAYEEYGPPPPRHVVYGPPAPVVEVIEIAPPPAAGTLLAPSSPLSPSPPAVVRAGRSLTVSP